MIVYQNTSFGFLEDVESNMISNKIKDSVLRTFGWNKIKDNEETSWINSMQFMGNVVRRAGIAKDCGVLIEYNLPSTSLRVDFILSGHDETGRPSFIIIELKQWKEANSTNKDGVVHTGYFGETAHPSYQAYSYKLYLKDFNQAIYSSSIEVHSCAYLHNYEEKNPEPLKAEIYKSIIRQSPLYFRDDQLQLEEFIRMHVGKGRGTEILYQIENGDVRPSKKLVDYVSSLFEGNDEFVLLDDQKVAYETARDMALHAKAKTVVIISGGPGTGKSVISMNLLGSILKAQRNVVFVAPTASFREVMLYRLVQGINADRVKYLLKGSSAFYGARKNTFDVLVVDEAHRLKNEGAYMYKGKNQVEDIVNASKVSVFFVDEKQAIRPEDIGTVSEINRVAEAHNAQVLKLNLKAQFRCSGAEGYINWVDDVLQLESTGNFDGWDKKEFEFRIFDNPNELRRAIQDKAAEGANARILAGYAWNWTAKDKGNPNGQIPDVMIPEFDFSMPWNSRKVGSTWAIDPSGINQAGCVHTSQGLEFDYVGVIVGDDLQFDDQSRSFITPWNTYKDQKGKRGMKKKPYELNRLVRNVYRILMTRGIKGCFIYFTSKGTQEYVKERLKQTL